MEKYILNREDTTIMIVDIQERLAPAMINKEEVINNVKILIKCAKEMGMPIVYTEQYPKGLGHTIKELNDVDYKWVRINRQIWMAQNLNFGYQIDGNFQQTENESIWKNNVQKLLDLCIEKMKSLFS